MPDIIDEPFETCQHCGVGLGAGKRDLWMPVRPPEVRISTCADCGQPAEFKGCWGEGNNCYAHHECYGSVTRQLVDGDQVYDVRTHHHFDYPFENWSPGQ